jgi:hypothetical protein
MTIELYATDHNLRQKRRELFTMQVLGGHPLYYTASPLIASLGKAALSHRKPATTGTSRDNCRAQGHDKGGSLHIDAKEQIGQRIWEKLSRL